MNENEKARIKAQVEDMLTILEPVANAVKRIDFFNGDDLDCTDDATITADDPDNGSFELFADAGEFEGEDPQVLLKVGHLRAITALYDQLKEAHG